MTGSAEAGLAAGRRRPLRIAILDYRVVPTNPIGGCHLRMLRGLCREHDFTVFAVEFENPCPERIRFVRVPAPGRPLALLFLAYHLLAPICYWAHRLRHRVRFDLVQAVESNAGAADVVYAQFCHRAYLDRHWTWEASSALRGALRWLDHRLHALLEPRTYRRAGRIVVPSLGLARELAAVYPVAADKTWRIPNPVGLERMQPPEGFDRQGFRLGLGLGPDDVALVFVALGHFERKGLPLLLESLRRVGDRRARLVVVGGEPDLVAAYRGRTARMGLGGQVRFAGMQRDVRPYLWGADALALPSAYETFSLVTLEAAAAGLPLVVSRLHGVEEFLRDGENGLLVERTPEGVARGVARCLALPPEARRAMGEAARRAAAAYAADRFVSAWRAFYESAAPAGSEAPARRVPAGRAPSGPAAEEGR